LATPRRLVEAVEVTESQIHLIRLKGIFDASTVSEFEKVVSYLLARNFFCMVVDLSYVEFISSAGWGAFTAELRRVRENDGDIKLAGMSSDLFDVFLLLELDRFISAYESEEEAIMAFLQPPPEPVVETPVEIPSSLRENFDAQSGLEAIETKLPTVYATASSALTTPANEDAMDYREKYGVNDETFALEQTPTAEFTTHHEDNWTLQENFHAGDKFAIENDRRMLGSGREMRERLLTSGSSTFAQANSGRVLPPPSLTTAHDNVDHSGVTKSTTPGYDLNDAEGTAELNFYENAPALDDDEPIAAPNAIESFSNSGLNSSGHKTNSDEAHYHGGFPGSSLQPERNQRPKKFSWQEAGAFSELSLDLESHLQAHDRRTEADDDFTAFKNFHTEQPYEPPPRHNNNTEETHKFNTIIFSPNETFTENDADDDTDFGVELSRIDDLKHELPKAAPIFNNKPEEKNFIAPLFSNNPTEFNSNVYTSGKGMTPGHDDDFETQDIRDPWILEEIDTLPEEYEMDEQAAADADRPIATEEFGAYDFAMQPESPPSVPEIERALEAQNIENEIEAPGVVEAPFENLRAAPPEEEAELSNLAVSAADGVDATATAADVDASADEQNVSAAASLPEAAEPSGAEEPLYAPANTVESGKIPMSGDLAEMIRGIIAAYPHYGPTMIGKFLEECVEPPVYLSRSTIYRYLRELNLSTRQQRLEYVGEEFDLSAEAAHES
jgi:anti-sigma B factor antagonist